MVAELIVDKEPQKLTFISPKPPTTDIYQPINSFGEADPNNSSTIIYQLI